MKVANGLVLTDFELTEELGSGSAGNVAAAVGPDGTPCVVKKFNSMAVDRAFSGAVLRRYFKAPPHPHVLPVLAGSFDRTPYFTAMPRVASTLEELQGIKEREAWVLLHQMVEAMGHLHKHDIPHGNLHPGNVFVDKGSDGCAVVKVADFGQGMAGRVHHIDLGERTYFAAPEQLESPEDWEEGAAEKWDVYRFGVIAFWLINGRLPRGDNHIKWRRDALASGGGRPVGIDPKAVAAAVREAPDYTWDRRPKSRAITLSREIVDRCLDLDPAKRPVDLREVRNDFRRMEAQFSLEDAEHRVVVERRKQSAKLFTSRTIAIGLAAGLVTAAVYLVRYLQESHVFRSRVDELQQVVSTQNGRIADTERRWSQTQVDLKTTRAAADAFFSEIARKGSEVTSFDKKELETSRNYYQKTFDEAPSEIEKARACYSLAHIQLRLGDRAVAGDSFRKAIGSIEKLLADGNLDDSTETDLWTRLADAYEQNSGLCATEGDEQLTSLQHAVRYVKMLRARQPDERNFPAREALLQQQLGGVLQRYRHFDEAVAAYAVAGEILDSMRTEAFSVDLEDRLSSLQFQTALSLREAGKLEAAVDAHLANFETLSRMENGLPGGLDPLQKLRMARGYIELGEIFSLTKMETDKLKDVFVESLRILRPVVDSRPDFNEGILSLARTCRRISRIEADADRWSDGWKLSVESIKNIESLAERVPEDLEVLLELAETRADHARLLSGQHAAATACVEKGLGVTDSVGARLVSLEGALPAPVRRTYEIRLARLYEDYGSLCKKLGIRDKAASCFGHAVARWEWMAQAEKDGHPVDPAIEASLMASRTLLDQAKR